MSDTALVVDNLGKRFHLGQRKPYSTLRDSLAEWMWTPLQRWKKKPRPAAARHDGTLWALKDVSFEVRRGEVIGIIGRNGSGKSTLLKILSRITEPTEGQAEVLGRVGSLLEVGTGFHSELTGRENIYLSGAILGMRRREIERKFDEIVAFAEVEKFLDTPVKHYSSGMHMRLAFAVAAHLEAEILLVDEVLAVGDQAFQQKCLGKMSEVTTAGRTVLFVSHQMAAVTGMCSRGIWLDGGKVRQVGEVKEVVEAYSAAAAERSSVALDQRGDRGGSGELRVAALEVQGPTCADGTPGSLMTGREMKLVLTLQARDERPVRHASVVARICSASGAPVFSLGTSVHGHPLRELAPQSKLVCRVAELPLVPGNYRVNVLVKVGSAVADSVEDAGKFIVEETDYFETGKLPRKLRAGVVLVKHGWEVQDG